MPEDWLINMDRGSWIGPQKVGEPDRAGLWESAKPSKPYRISRSVTGSIVMAKA